MTPCDQNIVTPLRVGDRLLVSSLDKGTMAIELTRSGINWTPRVAWHTTEVSMYMSSPVLAGGQVLGLSHKKKGQYFALDADTGKVRWTSEGGQGENAALSWRATRVLVLQGDGTLLVLSASRRLRARPKVPGGRERDARTRRTHAAGV